MISLESAWQTYGSLLRAGPYAIIFDGVQRSSPVLNYNLVRPVDGSIQAGTQISDTYFVRLDPATGALLSYLEAEEEVMRFVCRMAASTEGSH